MPNILILNTIVPYPPHYNGNALRVFPLSNELAKQHRCFLAAFGEENGRFYALKQTGVFQEILLLPRRNGKKVKHRHFFLRTGHLAKVAQPVYYSRVVKTLTEFIGKKHIDLLITHVLNLSEYSESIRSVPKILDDIDCRTLALRRRYTFLALKLKPFEKIKYKIQILRAIHQERRITSKFDFITTVSPVDRDTLRSLSGNKHERIINIPNGISPELVHYGFKGEEIPDAIGFWGALDFLPNSAAVHFFYNEIFYKYLQHKGITWYIIGKNPDDKMIEMGKRHKNIIITGFVDDLYSLVSRIPIMINPMQTGGGIKNKVLEAFALERLVISNEMGMEALNAKRGVHYIHAEEPKEFAEKIMKYAKSIHERIGIGKKARRFVLENFTWEKIGEKYLDLIDRALYG